MRAISLLSLLLCGVLLCALFLQVQPAWAASMPGVPSTGSTTKSEKPHLPDPAELAQKTPQEIDKLLASMPDQEARTLLLQTLQQEVAARQQADADPDIAAVVQSLRQRMESLRKRIAYVFSGASHAPSFLPQALDSLAPGASKAPIWRLFSGLAVLTLIWAGAHWLLRRQTRELRQRLESVPEGAGALYKLSRMLFRTLLELVFLVAALFAVIIAFLLLFNESEAGRHYLLALLLSVVFLDLVILAGRSVLAPSAPALRVLPLQDAAATQLFRLVRLVGAEIALGMLLSGIMKLSGSNEALYLLTLSVTGLVVVLTIVFASLWKSRDVARQLRAALPPGTLRHQLAGSWHVVLGGYLFFFWLFWVAHLVAFGSTAMLPGMLTLLAFPAYLLLTLVVDKMVVLTGNIAKPSLLPKDKEAAPPEHDYLLDADGQPLCGECPVARFRRFLHKSFGFLLLALFLLTLAHIWDIELPIASRVTQGAFSALVTLLLGYIFWAFCKASIERKLRAQSESPDGDEPGMGSGDRLHTLLELLKRFIFVALVLVITLIILSSLGVDTAPLLAGASVFGIAIGFGSQTLVKDIVSGVFFLMDDAFRIGDYIELGNARGTVEGISVRSLKLRHHRGALYTIPYGSIQMVENLSRDWAIMKLEYVVPHDTDIQEVKKIVKRINKEIKAIPELEEVMLGDIKSQGVKTIEDYGMRMRIKMTTKPGGQYTLRKWIWGKLRRYFDEAGIEFAHRKVSVMLPEGGKLDKEALEAAGAAAERAIEDEQQAQKPPKRDI